MGHEKLNTGFTGHGGENVMMEVRAEYVRLYTAILSQTKRLPGDRCVFIDLRSLPR